MEPFQPTSWRKGARSHNSTPFRLTRSASVVRPSMAPMYATCAAGGHAAKHRVRFSSKAVGRGSSRRSRSAASATAASRPSSAKNTDGVIRWLGGGVQVVLQEHLGHAPVQHMGRVDPRSAEALKAGPAVVPALPGADEVQQQTGLHPVLADALLEIQMGSFVLKPALERHARNRCHVSRRLLEGSPIRGGVPDLGQVSAQHRQEVGKGGRHPQSLSTSASIASQSAGSASSVFGRSTRRTGMTAGELGHGGEPLLHRRGRRPMPE